MNRQFQAKASFRHYALLAVLLSVAIYFAWHTESLTRQWSGALIAITLLAMVIIVEKIIHSTYTITKQHTLVIHKGRFSKDKIIPLDDIDRIDRINRNRIGGKPMLTYLVIVLKDSTEYYINPKNEEDFIKCVIQKKKKKEQAEDSLP